MRALLVGLALLGASTLGAAAPLCGTAYAQSCCKVCSKGKACGNSCIARDKVCHKGKGCACNA
jgi:hypothetical protein